MTQIQPPMTTPLKTLTQPTGDRRNPALVARLNDAVAKLPGGSTKARETMGKMIGSTGTYVHRYLTNDFRGDLAKFESQVLRYFEAEVLRTEGNTEIVPEGFSVESMRSFLRQIKAHCHIGVGYGDAGRGKTCAARLFAAKDPATIYIYATMWASGRHAIARAIKSAIKAKLGRNETTDEALVRLLRNSGRLLIIDNAQRLTESARRWLADFWDETRIPIALIGNPEIVKQWARNDQHGSRVGLRRDVTSDIVKSNNAQVAAEHLIRLHLPDQPDLRDQVAATLKSFGSARAAAMHLTLTKAMLAGGKFTDASRAFAAASTQLITMPAAS